MKIRTDARRAYEAKWRAKNHEKHKENQRRWRLQNPERVLEQKRAWNDTHRDLLNQRSRDRYRRLAAIGKRRNLPEATRPVPENCEGCGQLFSETKRGACLDHCHAQNIFRGWLCQKCNTALGMVGDSKDGVLKLLAYLERVELLS